MNAYDPDEMMTIAAARMLGDRDICFVGIGLPSAACNLARLTHAPDIVLIYESGTIGTRPGVLPLSIGDGELADTAACIVSLPEIFSYFLQAGRVDVGFLGAAQIDRYGNLNSTVIGPYARPAVRLPGGGGAPEIAAHARRTLVVMKATPRSCVERLAFTTSAGFLEGGDARERTSARGAGPAALITDVGILTPDSRTRELKLTALYPGVTADAARAQFGWPLAVADPPTCIAAPTDAELSTLRELHARTAAAHARPIALPLHAHGTDS
jgi:glutaconate CoA-transferase subunit B